MKTKVPRLVAAGCVLSLAIAGTSVAVRETSQASADSTASLTAAAPGKPLDAALRTAERLVQGRAAELKASSADAFIQRQAVTTPWGLQYVSYERTYQDLPVIGGDFVVTTDAQGNNLGLAVAQQRSIDVSIRPTVPKSKAVRTARATFDVADPAAKGDPTLVVYAGGKTPVLAWEAVVKGKDEGEPSHQKVYVDARNGKVLDAVELTATGTGTGAWSGANLAIGTTQSGSTFTMTDPARPNLRCGDLATGRTYSGPDDVWGSVDKKSREAGCVDIMYASAGQWDMLKNWFGRNGLDGRGNWADALVGMQEQNAHWDGPHNVGGTAFGYNTNNEWATQIDIVAHEYGHGLDANTPGGISGHPTQEAVADIWGALTEAYLNNPNDAPDYEVGEKVDLSGRGPIRYMYDPSKAGHPNCYSAALPSSVHAAAGPMNHWFYLLAEGTNPTNGQPVSPTCNNTALTGIGHEQAGKIFYNAMLTKTTGMTYPKWRLGTLAAAKNLDPTCALHAKVKAAWTAVNLGAQAGEATCAATGNDYTLSVSPATGSVKPGESVAATVNTTIANGAAQTVKLAVTGLPTGATATFDPSSVQSGNSAKLTIATTSSTPVGTYDLKVTADGVDVDKSATYRLTVGGAAPSVGVPDIDVEKVKAHLLALQQAADNNGGNRRAGSAGYTASVAYIEQKLRAAGYTVAKQRCTTCTYPSDNLIADFPGGDPNQVIMLGAHLDTVGTGAGSNDNASGSATILEVALRLAQENPTLVKHVRFAWWTDEEQGMNGSEYYVGQLPTTERSKIKAYFNFDMVGSTNAGYFVNNITSTTGQVLKAFYDGLNLQPEENVEGVGRSDDASFKNAGIPTSGVAAGASARKTTAQATKWGGTANVAYDPCYHSACDKYPANVSATVLDRSADAAAYGLWKLAVGDTPPITSDFSVSLSPTSGSVAPGNSVKTTVSTATTSGDPQSVQLSASGLPAGATATFTPSTLNSGGTSGLTITTATTTAPGTYQVTVKGTGAVSHQVTYNLTVTGTSAGTVTVLSPGAKTWWTGIQIFPLQLKATSSTGRAVTFRATGLPPGLTISSTGVITGTPSTAGIYRVVATATDTGGATGSTTFTYTIYQF